MTLSLIFLIISIFIAIGIGANDETFSTLYGSKILSMRQILLLATIFAITGAIFLGEGVSKTVGKNILEIEITHAVVITILISTTIWLIISSSLGLPISTTHATIGAILGIGIFLGGINGVNWQTILTMSSWWIFSPIIGYISTYFSYKLLQRYKIKRLNGFIDYQKTEKRFSVMLLVIICMTAFSRAGNDCSNAIGIVVGMEIIDVDVLLIISGISFALGIILIGRSVIKSVGTITELRPSTAFASEAPTALILFIGTLLGIPLSGSHMLIASLIGLSKASRNPVREKKVLKIFIIWLLTFPIAAILSYLLYFPVVYFLP
ncbi:MAG: inorganic phosphate transporter [Promethearchaeota archaeon]